MSKASVLPLDLDIAIQKQDSDKPLFFRELYY